MSVKDAPRNQRYSASKSGIMPRPVIEPEGRREPPQPNSIPELREEDGATTGVFPVVSEGHDSSAIGDVDKVRGS